MKKRLKKSNRVVQRLPKLPKTTIPNGYCEVLVPYTEQELKQRKPNDCKVCHYQVVRNDSLQDIK